MRVEIENPRVRAMGAVNLVRFDQDGPRGFNTDHSGFLAAFRSKFGTGMPGAVCQIGAGGAGKAIGFAMAALGAVAIRIVDVDRSRARALAGALRSAYPGLDAAAAASLDEAVAGARGLVNCSPVGMTGHDGTPVPRPLMQGAAWVFDAVYTPVRTRFLTDAEASGLDTPERLRALLPSGSRRPRDLPGKRGRPGSTPAGAGQVESSARRLTPGFAAANRPARPLDSSPNASAARTTGFVRAPPRPGQRRGGASGMSSPSGPSRRAGPSVFQSRNEPERRVRNRGLGSDIGVVVGGGMMGWRLGRGQAEPSAPYWFSVDDL